jgi:selenide,water dikinase
MYRKGENTGSNKANRAMVAKHKLEISVKLSKDEEELLYDPQTSGGLLLSVPGAQADRLVAALKASGVHYAVCIGLVTAEPVGILVK